jgi:galactose oxidase
MSQFLPFRSAVVCWLPVLTLALGASSSRAQVSEVVVGITPSCPYGIGACWAGAYEALGRLDGVKSVARTPNAYNCTAIVHLKSASLPDVEHWTEQFKSMVGQLYEFRGVEATVEGLVEQNDGGLVVRLPGLEQPVALLPLEHKLQWNFKRGAARQPEPVEQASFDELRARRRAATSGELRVQVTGPLRKTEKGTVLEVRECFPLEPIKDLSRGN